MKDKKGKTVLNTFKEIVNESNCEPNKLWFDEGREFYNKLRQESILIWKLILGLINLKIQTEKG